MKYIFWYFKVEVYFVVLFIDDEENFYSYLDKLFIFLILWVWFLSIFDIGNYFNIL